MGIARIAWLLLPLASAAQAQYIDNSPQVKEFTEEEIAAVPMPELAFDAGKVAPGDFEKYFYFQRPQTGFAEALRDINECDALAQGTNIYMGADQWTIQNAMLQYGAFAGAAGGAIAGLLIDGIFGSSARRMQRRTNMRQCMHFKGYDRYGLEKDLWQEFHFEEGFSAADKSERIAKLKMQARVASGPAPVQERLDP